MKLWLDIETFSATPITDGVHRYAEGAEVMIRAVALDDGDVLVRDLTPGGQDWLLVGDVIQPAPSAMGRAVDAALADDSVEVYAHNAPFDKTLERHAGLEIPLHRWRDTMIQALAHSLPGKLENLCEALGLATDKGKDKAGKGLIQLFCRPQKFHFRKRYDALIESAADYAAAKAEAEANWAGRCTRETHPDEWRRFLVYAGQDIIAMRECSRRMPTWNYPNKELALWHLDQRINDRGVHIDTALAEAALRAVDLAQEGLREETLAATNGEVESANKRDALLQHIMEAYGVPLPDMQKATLERRIADPDLPEGLRELLRIRLQVATTSTSKYKTLLRCVSSDGRLRGLLQFNGAARTGRWAGRLWQPQNLPSRGLLPQSQIALGIEALLGDFAHLVFPNVMHLTSSAIRGCITAPPGKKLVVADLSNIEGRGIAWLAGENWKLKAFREFDAGRGHDLYKLAYAASFGIKPDDVTKDQRQIGKVQELACGYQGGVGAFVTFAAGYGIDLDELAARAVKFIPGEAWGQANIMLQWHRDKGRDPAADLGLKDQTWLVCEAFVLGWRSGHPAIKTWWHDLEDKIREAITTPGTTVQSGKVKIRRDGAWLRLVLPSGRALCYPSPKLEPEKRKKRAEEADAADVEDVEQSASGRTVISYMGLNQYTRKWSRLHTYGGKVAENLTQAVARDVMAHNMPAIEDAGYAIVLTVHDEILAEAPDTPEYNADHLAALLCTNPPWALDMPLAAAGFEAYRYKKE